MLEEMLSWDKRTNCITEWRVPGWPRPLNFIGWGCEVGNGFGFFAHERLGGLYCRIESRQLERPSPTKIGSRWQIKLPQTRLNLQTVNEMIRPNQIIRNLAVTNPSEKNIAWITDAVIRLVVPREEGLVAEFEQRDLVHKGSNFYHETEEPEVSLRWADGRRLVVRWLEKPYTIPALTPYLYVRDQPATPQYNDYPRSLPAWVIHARLLVDYPAAFVFRLWRDPCVIWSRGFFGRYLLKRRYLKYFWRGGELHPGLKWYIFGIWPLVAKQSFNYTIMIEAN